MSPTPENVVAACARAAHETNRAFCIAIGDFSIVPWEQAPEWQRQSSLKGVEGALAGATPEQSHESWLEEKRRDGWSWGPAKDPANKRHPCFAPYGDLDPMQRMKDQLYLTVVRSMASAFGEDTKFDPLETRKYVESLEAIVRAESPGDMFDLAKRALAP